MKNTIVIAFVALLSFSTFAADLSSFTTGELLVMQDHNIRVLSGLDRDNPMFDEIVIDAKEIIKELSGRPPLDEEDSREQEEVLKGLI